MVLMGGEGPSGQGSGLPKKGGGDRNERTMKLERAGTTVEGCQCPRVRVFSRKKESRRAGRPDATLGLGCGGGVDVSK